MSGQIWSENGGGLVWGNILGGRDCCREGFSLSLVFVLNGQPKREKPPRGGQTSVRIGPMTKGE